MNPLLWASVRALRQICWLALSGSKGQIAAGEGRTCELRVTARPVFDHRNEVSPNFGDGRDQAAAAWAFDLTTSIPSVNFTPMMSFGNWLWPSSRRQLLSAASASLKIMASAVLFERHPLERTVRCRMVANELSMTLVVRRCFQCSAGKS